MDNQQAKQEIELSSLEMKAAEIRGDISIQGGYEFQLPSLIMNFTLTILSIVFFCAQANLESF